MPGASEISLRRSPGAFEAAEVSGLEPLRDATHQGASRLLREALWTHGVICVRFSRSLDDREARALVSMVGNVKDPIGRTRDGGALRYGEDRQIIDSGLVMTDEIRAAIGDVSLGGDDERPGLFEFFHTDDSYTELPASATLLHARALPKGGGGPTCFLDMRTAFELLPAAQQRQLEPRFAMHSYNNGGAFPPRVAARGEPEALVDVEHPIVRAHPVTGRSALYFDLDRATHIAGMPVHEGREVLRSLQEHAERNAPRYEHAWQEHDVLIWDNASVQHKANGNFAVGEERRFWRYMVEGTRPVSASARAARRAR